MNDRSSLTEINVGSWTNAVAFSANGEYLLSGGAGGVRVWGVEDGKQVATMATAGSVLCLAVSKDGRWIAAGTRAGEVIIWDAKTYDSKVLSHQEDISAISGVDFSPNSTQLLVASDNRIATVWDVSTPNLRVVRRLRHQNALRAAKYSPQGDRIATATRESVQLYDSNDGRLLVDVKVKVAPWFNTGLLWSDDDQLFVVSDGRIGRIGASAGSVVSEWPELNTTLSSCIDLSRHGEFIAYSANCTVTFWDMSTHTQLGLIDHTDVIRSIALLSHTGLLAIGGKDGKIAIKSLSRIIESVPLSRLHPTLQEPEIRINDAALDSWNRHQLANAQLLLTEAVADPRNPSHHIFASRALVRAHLGQWDAAIDDAKMSIKIQPSVIGYVAKSVALVGKGKRHEGYRACDVAFEHFHSTHVTFLLLIKAIVVCMAGEHDDAISRLDDLIAMLPFNPTCHVVQAYMYLLLGNSRMESSDYRGAMESFELARSKMRRHGSQPPVVISLISGWKFDDLGLTIRQRLCEALYGEDRVKDAGESLLDMVNTFDPDVYVNRPIATWVSDFTHRCLSIPESASDAASMVVPHDEATMLHMNPNSTTPTLLLKEWAKSTLASGEWKDALVTAVNFTAPRSTVYRALCGHLKMTNCLMEATKCLHQMNSELAGETTMHDEQAKWAVDFKQRCAEELERLGDAAADAQQYDNAITQYSVALSLNPAIPQEIFIKRSKVYIAKELWEDALDDTNHVISLVPLSLWGYENVLIEWAKVKLTDGSWRNALTSAGGFKVSRFMIYQVLCERLEMVDRVSDAAECFHSMENELVQEIQGNEATWVLNFKSRCCGKLEDLADTAMNSGQYDEAINQYSATLSLNPTAPQGLIIKRSKVYLAKGLWEDALHDANKVIMIDPLSPWGYERKHAALHKAGDYENATDAFEAMLSKISESPDPDVREHSRWYVNPAQTKATICAAIENVIRESPLVLINTGSGRLLDKSEQASSFKSQRTFVELVSSMTTYIDHARIEKEVAEYYRYAMFSHKWQENEPLFDKVIRVVVYDLEKSPTHDKLKTFCKIVRDAGLHWAWCDTCCINKVDHVILQEALVAMFKWYQGSAVTIVFLHGVRSPSRRGDLVKSIWNTRAWTFQEYHASKVVRFYNEDWTPYLNLDIPNHKESLEIISEMEEVTGVSARALMSLQPGLDDIREKLRLASARQTTRAEDAAYSLLGIFSISLPVVYGEGNKALGRLLAQLLTSSGDVSILAWTGKSGGFNSCLPVDIAVFNWLPTTHIPPAFKDAETHVINAGPYTSSLHLAPAMKLYDRLDDLPVPLFAGQRMRLPCIIFKLGSLLASPGGFERVFRAQTAALGIVEIKTKEDLSQLDSLYLIHPWIDFLLDRQPLGSVSDTISAENTDDLFSLIGESPSFPGPLIIPSATPQPRAARLAARLKRPFSGRASTPPRDVASLRPPSSVSRRDKQMHALRLVARLRQPFGALLLTPSLGKVAAYKRVAAESLITVRVEEITPTILKHLVGCVRILDVV